MTASGHDAKWWQQFTVAPPQLQKAMHSTLKAREILELRNRLGIDDDAELAVYEQRLKEREQTEHRIREALHRDRLDPPISREVAAAPKTTRGVAPDLGSSPAASGADRFW